MAAIDGGDRLLNCARCHRQLSVCRRCDHGQRYCPDPCARLADLAGGDPAENAALIRRVLDGEPGPRRDIVCLNAAAGIVAGGKAATLAEGLRLAAAAVDTGAAARVLQKLVERSKS